MRAPGGHRNWGSAPPSSRRTRRPAVICSSVSMKTGPGGKWTISRIRPFLKTRCWRCTARTRCPWTTEPLKPLNTITASFKAAGSDRVPCHGDGVASNVMINPAGAVRLVDFDSAGNHDPYFDLGSLIVEIAQCPALARSMLEIYAGECRDAADRERSYFLKVPGERIEYFIDRNAANEASRRASESGPL